MFVNEGLIREIEHKKELVARNPSYWLQREQKLKHAIEKSAKTYEYFIKHPELSYEYGSDCNGKKRGMKIAALKKGIRNLFNAWEYISHTDDFLTKDVLFKVGQLVDPDSNRGFRNCRVTLRFKDYAPVNNLKIESMIEETFDALGNKNVHLLERAATAHLHFVGIQPFLKGNKRIAQLFQNRILYGAGLPAVIIPLSERMVYCGLLEGGLVSWRDDTPHGRNMFYNYIGSKVNLALDEIIENNKSNGKHR